MLLGLWLIFQLFDILHHGGESQSLAKRCVGKAALLGGAGCVWAQAWLKAGRCARASAVVGAARGRAGCLACCNARFTYF